MFTLIQKFKINENEKKNLQLRNFYLKKKKLNVYLKKFIFFGKKIEKTRPKKVFEIYANANNPSISKEWWYKAISDEVAKLERKEEIDKGFLI